MGHRHRYIPASGGSAPLPYATENRSLARPGLTLKVGSVLALWTILIFSPHWFLLARGAPQIVLRAQLVVLVLVVGLLMLEVLDRGRLKTLWPLMAYAACVIISAQYAYHPGEANPYSKQAQVAVIMAVATLTIVRHPLHIRTIVLMMLLYRFAWFGLIGVYFGKVRFDPYLGNPDQFGSLMAMGTVAAASVGLSTRDPRLRKLGAGVALLSMAGVVSSFARGAFLATGLAVAFLWFRLDGRRLALGGLIAMSALTAVVAGSILTGHGRGRGVSSSWFDEMSSVSGDIADSGAEDRRLIWRIGWQVFKDHPVTGVGPGSWSVYASENYRGPIMGERFARRPDQLWGRAMHNIYIERLAELGLVGFSLFVLLLIDYWRRIVAVRTNATDTDTSVLPGLRTKVIATGFEASMVANLAAGILYNVVGASFYALLIANALFHMAWARRHDVRRSRPQSRPHGPLVSRLTT